MSKQVDLAGLVTWRALQPCFVHGVYREEGEVFQAPDSDYAPDVREKVAPGEPPANATGTADAPGKAKAASPAKSKGRAAAAAAPGVTPDELPAAGDA